MVDIQLLQKKILLRNISISLQDVKRIVERLLPYVQEEGHNEVNKLLQSDFEGQMNIEQLNYEREQAFRITVTIDGRDGESLFGYGTEPFDSPNIPDPINSIFISNNAAYERVVGRRPLNNFTLHLDFSTPPLVDMSNLHSSPTSNFSSLTIDGVRDSWGASIQQTVLDILNKKSNGRGRRLLHTGFIYDIGVVLLGLPAAIYLCWSLSGFVQTIFGSFNLSPFIVSAVYIYIVLLVLNVYRVLFGYLRWTFPVVELIDNCSRLKTHRKLWYGIVISPILKVLYDWIF